MAETVEQIIRRVAAEVGVDPDLAVAVARQESGLNPRAHNPNGEDSWGLFQGNRNGGMGTGYSPEQLMDPEFNARLMLSAMAATQKKTGLTGGQLAAASQRPADPQGYARSVNAMLSGGRGLPHTGSPFSPNTQGAPPVATTPTKSNATIAAEKRVEAARKAFEELDAQKQRASLKTDANLLTDEQKAIDEEWRTGIRIVIKDNKATEQESPLVKQWKDAQTALADAEGKLASALDADIKNAPANDKSGGPGSSTERYLVNPDGTVRRDADGQPMENPNYRAPAGDSGDGSRVVGRALVGPDGQVIYRDPDAPEDPSLVAQRGASTAVSLAQLEKLELDLEIARKAQERLAVAQGAVDIALALPEGPERTTALRAATRGVLAISDPVEFERSIREEATQEINRQREEREAQEFQALQTQRETENTRNAETSARQEREGVATGLRGLMGLEQTRKKGLADALSDYEHTGISTSGRIDNLKSMQSSGLTPELAATSIGLDPNSPKFQTIWQSAQSFLGGQGMAGMQPSGQSAQPPTPAAAPPPRPAPGPVASIARGSMGPQAADLSGIGGAGWGQAYNPQTGAAEGDPYDIPEEGEQAAPAGPPPAPNSVQQLIRSLSLATA